MSALPRRKGGAPKKLGFVVDQIWDGAPDEAERQKRKSKGGLSQKPKVKIRFGTKKKRR